MTLKDLSQPSSLRWLLRATLNWVEIILIFFVMAKINHLAVQLLGLFLLGTRQHALALLGLGSVSTAGLD